MSNEDKGEKEDFEEETKDIDVAIGLEPSVICSDDLTMMDLEGIEIKTVKERGGFLGFGSSEEPHIHLKYTCSKCGGSYHHDMEMRRQQGCFIATAAYGTPLAEEINVLRRFRDSYLVRRDWGQKLIQTYYTVSPPIAEIIGKSESLRKLVRVMLKPIIKIFEKGEESGNH